MGNIKILSNIIIDPATASRALKLDSSKVVGSGTPTDTEQGYVSGVTSAIQTQFTNKTNNSLRIAAALGSVIVAETVPLGQVLGNTGALVDGRFYCVACWLEKDATLTGVKWYQGTQGAYTGDNNSKIGLYTYSGGNITLVASCANDTALWKTASNTWASKAFSGTYAAAAGLYFVGFLYNSSAQTTAPIIGAAASFANNTLLGSDFTNSAKIAASLNTQTDLPSPTAMSGLTVLTFIPYFALY